MNRPLLGGLDPVVVTFGPAGREPRDKALRFEAGARREVRLVFPDQLGTATDMPRDFFAHHGASVDLTNKERAEQLERQGSVCGGVMSELRRVGVGQGWVLLADENDPARQR